MLFILLDVNPVLAGFGQLAAIIICLFALIYILIAVAFNLAMVLGTSWLREKANLIKMLRPTVNSVNKTTEAAIEGRPASQDSNTIIRNVSKVPAGVHVADKKVDEVTQKVAHGAIEFRARTLQVQTVVKTFLFPPRKEVQVETVTDEELQFKSPGYRALMEEKAPATPEPVVGDGYTTQGVTASQLSRDVPAR
jgi:hypothetical protein